MTLVFRITVDDAVAHAIAQQLRPTLRPAHGQTRVSNQTVRHTLAPALRHTCDVQLADWMRTLEGDAR